MTNKRYYFDSVPDLFMSSPQWYRILDDLINNIDSMSKTQITIDNAYSEMCTALLKEMDNNLKYSDSSKSNRKRFKNFKPYWSDDLTDSWNAIVSAEKEYKRFRGGRMRRSELRDIFTLKRSQFDKLLRNSERKYNRELADKIDSLNTEDPKQFWDHIKKLGPSKRKQIPMQIYDENGVLTNDTESVLNHWKLEYQTLFHMSESSADFDEDFYIWVKSQKVKLENDFSDCPPNNELDSRFTLEEVLKGIRRLKCGKSTGST